MRKELFRKLSAASIALTVIAGALFTPALGAVVGKAAPEGVNNSSLAPLANIAAKSTAYADEYMWLTVRSTGSMSVTQNGAAELVLSITNTRTGDFKFDEAVLEFEDKTGITVSGGVSAETSFSESGDAAEVRFDIKTSRFCETGMRDFRLILKNDGETVYTSRYFALTIRDSVTPNTEEGKGDVYVNTVDIYHSLMPESGLVTGDGNEVAFQVFNGSTAVLRSAQIKIVLPDGFAINNGSNVSYLGNLSQNKTITASFPVVVESGVEDKNYVFSAEVTGFVAGADGREEVSYKKDFYIPVDGDGVADDDEPDSVHTPQLMVSSYSYGGRNVLAGSDFPLEITFKNTSKQNLYNIKAVVESQSGTFVPVNSSNAFYIESVAAGAETTQTIVLSAAHDAEHGTTGINVSMSYESSDGDTYSADDTISIPVAQETRLVVDAVVPPYETYVGMEAYATVNYYNMGRTELANVRIDVEGDFDVYESNSEYAGNMSSGSKDDYRFVIIPRAVGPVTGKVVFTYEDASGTEQREEVAFTFEAMEMPVYDDPFIYEEPDVKEAIPWGLIIGTIVFILLIIALIVFRKIRKKRREKALELEDALYEVDEVADEAAPETAEAPEAGGVSEETVTDEAEKENE